MINLFLTHALRQCGVKAHGNRFVQAMTEHCPPGDRWIVSEIGNMDHIREAVRYWKPDITIINFHPSTTPRLEPERNFNLKTIFVALPHEDLTPDGARNFRLKHTQFEAALWQDTTLGAMGDFAQYRVYVIPRCIPRFYKSKRPDRRDIPKDHAVIKMFGFGQGGKMPEACVQAVEESFDKATIVGHFPLNEHADPDGYQGELMIEKLRAAVTKPGIQVLRSYEMYCRQYMSENDLVQWLADADANISMHEDDKGTGISSTTDLMMAAGVPFAVNDSAFYKHLPKYVVLGPGNTLRDIMNRGIEPWRKLAQEDWSPKTFAEGVRSALTLIKNRVR